MPELPDITVYIDALSKRIHGQRLEHIEIRSPFLLRTATPPITTAERKTVLELRRIGKRICIGLQEDLWLVIHLMVAGRLHWHMPVRKVSARDIAAFVFDNGTLTLTEAGSQKRASLHLMQGGQNLQSLDPGGLEIYEMALDQFTRALRSENHTLKRALTDPRLLSGIGNAYSDEILFHARLSPIALTQKLTTEEYERLFAATRNTLLAWIERLRSETGEEFPEKVTAFRKGMAVHGRFQEPCPQCGSKVQRIRHATNETNYCPTCQTRGRLLADRSLSRLLRNDWPKTAEDLG
ncbi:MAG: Fpg/Nei family DNA glycosylase [Pyrinomonadaceae bacterium]